MSDCDYCENEINYHEIIDCITCALDARDPYTAGHSERYDGKGYPLGRSGADIPIGARIIAVCDSIDAITSNRCYRKAHDFDYCYEEIAKNLGTMYDPMVGQYVLDNWEKITGVVREQSLQKYFQQKYRSTANHGGLK